MSFLSQTWSTVKSIWSKFETWCASWMPGLKTYIVTALGAIGSLAATLQEYVTGLPLSTFMTGTQVAIATTVLFSLAFWFRHLSDVNAVNNS